jgi:protease PrsW
VTAHVRSRSARTAPVRPTPASAGADGSLRLPGFWLVAGLLLAGGLRLATILREAIAAYPAATTAAVALFTVYAVPFWIFVRALDYMEREPPVLLATAFAWGGLVSTSIAINGSGALHDLLAKLVSPEFAAAWGPAVAGPAVEEIAKVLGVVAIVLVARTQVNSVLDGVVYGALVGLGFQVVEDIVYSVNAVVLAGRGDQVDPVIATFFLRGFLAGLWSHTLFGALAGAGVGYLVVRTDRVLRTRVATACLAVVGAWLCHFLWNSPLLADGGGLGVLAGLLIKGVPPLLTILLLVKMARAREADYYAAYLTALHDARVITPAEVRVLGRSRLRAEARRYAHGRTGSSGLRAVRRLQHAQARLAVALSRAGGGPLKYPGAGARAAALANRAVRRHYDEVLAQRSVLVALHHPEAIAPNQRRTTVRRWVTGVATLVLLFLVWVAIRSLGAA